MFRWIFAFSLGIILLIGFIVPMSLNPDQIYPRPEPQEQIDAGLAVAPYDRGGEILKTPGIVMAQFPQNAEEIGMITSYMSPVAFYGFLRFHHISVHLFILLLVD